MTKRTKSSIAASVGLVVVAAGAFVLLDAKPGHGDDTPHCGTHDEYDSLHVGQSPATVNAIFGFAGDPGPGGPDTFVRKYKPCWAPDQKVIVVVFDQDAALSIRWRVDDV